MTEQERETAEHETEDESHETADDELEDEPHETADDEPEGEPDEAADDHDELAESDREGERPQSGAPEAKADEEVEFSEKRVISGGDFERELQLTRAATVSFLRDLADELESGRTVTVGTDDWEIPFEYGEPIEVEIEHEGDADEERELEIEVELEWASDGDGLEVR